MKLNPKLAPEIEAKVEKLVELITSGWKTHFENVGWNYDVQQSSHTAHYHVGKKYIRVDTGDSGTYMIDIATQTIYGIKAYGVVHPRYVYGTLDTLDEFHWGNYKAVRKLATKITKGA